MSADRRRTQAVNKNNVKLIRLLCRASRGKDISWSYRKQQEENEKSLTFGEVEEKAFLKLLELCAGLNPPSPPRTERVFVDLGCAVGRACFCAALSSYRFTHVWGIELIGDLGKNITTTGYIGYIFLVD
jgi:SAM-dependent methyltransferase